MLGCSSSTMKSGKLFACCILASWRTELILILFHKCYLWRRNKSIWHNKHVINKKKIKINSVLPHYWQGCNMQTVTCSSNRCIFKVNKICGMLSEQLCHNRAYAFIFIPLKGFNLARTCILVGVFKEPNIVKNIIDIDK